MRVNRDIDLLTPEVDEREAEPVAGPAHMSKGRRHETAETALLLATVLFAFMAAASILLWIALRAPLPTAPKASSDPMDGSTAGANAVTIEELAEEARRNGE